MKIILLYGPGEAGKRTEGLNIRKFFPREAISQIDLKQASLKDLENLILARPLFETGPRLIVAENVSEKTDLKGLRQGSELTLLLMAPSLKADSALLKSAKESGVKIILFEGEKEILAFPYLDYLIERKKQVFMELEKLLEVYGGMYILSMVYYLLRRNLLPPASSFMQKKVQGQKLLYQPADWQALYKLALLTEFNIKSGVVPEKQGLISLTQAFISGNFGKDS